MKFSPSLKPTEITVGFSYLLIDLFVLPAALGILNSALPQPLNAATLNFIFFAINFAAIVLIFRRYLRADLRGSGKKLGLILVFYICGLVLYFVSNFLMSLLIGLIQPDFSNINDDSIAIMTQDNFLLVAVGTVLLVPAAEELLYRVLIFRTLYERKPVLGWIVSVAVFSLVHVMGYLGSYDLFTIFLCLIQYVPAGIVLAWIYQKSGTILTPILVHTTVNLVGILAMR